MDIIADTLLGLATCDSSVKSFSDILSSLHSINALHRLKEKADVVEVLLLIASFAPFFGPLPNPSPSTNIDVRESTMEARLERLERREETLRLDRLAVPGERQDGTTLVITETPAFVHPSMFQDGRDDDGDVPPAFQSDLRQPGPLAHLIYPVRKSDLTPFAPKEKPLYSFLIHFPIFRAFDAELSTIDREDLFSLPVMQKWGFEDAMTTCAYPRLRLTNGSTACIVVDDELERLEEIRKDLREMEKELWEKGAVDNLDRIFFLVGTWIDELVTLVFSVSCLIKDREGLGSFERWTTTPDAFWKDILDVHPVLSRYQETASGQEGGKPLLGARLFYQTQRYSAIHSSNVHRLTLVAPFLGSPHALLFARDFVAQHPKVDFVLDGKKYRVGVQAVNMGPPALNQDVNWDGPVLRNDKWQNDVDRNFDDSTHYV